MEERSALEKLSEKITMVMERHGSMNAETVRLREENAHWQSEIAKLREELSLKDREIEEIISKIESILA